MKQVEVVLRGSGLTYVCHEVLDNDKLKEHWDDDEPFFELEQDGTLSEDLIQFDAILDDVEVIQYDNDYNEIDITKQKGKYIKTRDYYTKMISKGDYICGGMSTRYEEHFTIELEDEEVFDPKKLQLVKSDYELDFLPYAIVMDTIYYDGKIIYTDADYDYDTPDRNYGQFIIDYNLPYGIDFQKKVD